MALPRRPVIVALIAVAMLSLGFVAAALTNPWHLTGLYPLAREGPAIGVLVFAGALLATAGLIRARTRVALVVAVVVVIALFGVLPAVVLDDSFRRESAGQVLSVSPDGEISAVKSTLDTKDGPRTRIYLRLRAGLFSRESALPAAQCPFDPFARGVPTEAVRFTGANTLAVPIADQPTSVVRFDPATLVPERTVTMCDPTG